MTFVLFLRMNKVWGAYVHLTLVGGSWLGIVQNGTQLETLIVVVRGDYAELSAVRVNAPVGGEDFFPLIGPFVFWGLENSDGLGAWGIRAFEEVKLARIEFDSFIFFQANRDDLRRNIEDDHASTGDFLWGNGDGFIG